MEEAERWCGLFHDDIVAILLIQNLITFVYSSIFIRSFQLGEEEAKSSNMGKEMCETE